ncbi:DUF2911 domain-containing protein [Maribacter sp. 2304DJ31-5]|uniref:DUF2911 domain-containing protein n=1 Tax=Maribacter sp. 2304DJ31-5 TaxID=3386273 RepID=UPI0039BD2E57
MKKHVDQLFISLFLIIAALGNAQINKPSLSPLIKTEQQVGLAKVTLEYGQPNMQRRTIFGKLIPFNRIWRTGANSSTKISFDKDIQLDGNLITAGSYSLYTIPGPKEWTVILNSNTKHWGSAGYNESEDVVRIKIAVQEMKDAKETLQIYFEGFNANGADMVIAWENTKISLPFFVDSDAAILKEIDQKINAASGTINAQTYFDAAQFYYFKDIDLDKAAVWFDKAIELRPSAFWYVYYKAELAYKLNKTDMARKAAESCLYAAKQSTSSDYGYIAKATLLLEKINN